MKEGGKLAAIIPAAGRSQRMGDLKPLLLLGSETMTERVVRVAREAGIDEILVVLGYGAERIIPHLEDRGIAWVLNPEFDAGMYTSVQAGVRQLDADVDGFLVFPGDMPMVRSYTAAIAPRSFPARPRPNCASLLSRSSRPSPTHRFGLSSGYPRRSSPRRIARTSGPLPRCNVGSRL